MVEYLIEDSTLTSIGDEIRTLMNLSGKMIPESMISNLKTVNSEINNQTALIEQILEVLDTKCIGELNFKIVGGTTQPTDAVENTIWINTNSEITSWEFSAIQPIALSGKVWICIGTSSSVEFNMIKKNGIKIYPLYAKQYIDSAWVNVNVKSYINNSWIDWPLDGYLYYLGNQCNAITGGWSGSATINSSGCMVFSGNLDKFTTNNILTRGTATKLHINITKLTRTNNGAFTVLANRVKDSLSSSNMVTQMSYTTTGEKIINLSNVTEPFYVMLFTELDTTVEVDRVWMD